MSRLSIELPDELHQALKMRAVTYKTTVAKMVRGLIENELAGPQTKKSTTPEDVEEQVTAVDRLLNATLDGKPLIKGIHPTGTARGQTKRPDLSKSAQAKGRTR